MNREVLAMELEQVARIGLPTEDVAVIPAR
jgi:hypothetical protein